MVEDHIALFWSNGRDLQEEAKFQAALNQLLKEFRKTLDDSSPLAKSIDDNDPSRTKAIIADQENYPQLAEILFLDTLEGDKRKEERISALGRRQEDRRKNLIDPPTSKYARLLAGQKCEETPCMREGETESYILAYATQVYFFTSRQQTLNPSIIASQRSGFWPTVRMFDCRQPIYISLNLFSPYVMEETARYTNSSQAFSPFCK